MEIDEMLQSDSVKTWFSGLNSELRLHSTKYKGIRDLKRFCEWTGKTPDELIRERQTRLASTSAR